jgi:glycosyltransferase involved in cell wall biosynthesis
LRVVIACDWFVKYAAQQSRALARRGAEVLLLCRTHSLEFGGLSGEREAALAQAETSGVAVLEVPGRITDVRVAGALVAIRRTVERFAPDIIHAHEHTDPRMLALVPPGPTILTVHDPVAHPGQPKAGLLERGLFGMANTVWTRRAGAVVIHSERLRSEIRLLGFQECVVIPHGVEVQTRPLSPPSQAAVGFFGRLTPYKGLEILQQAMPLVWRVRPNVHLRVAGAGDVSLGLEDSRVHIDPRYLPERELGAFFSEASIAVLPYTQASQTGAGSLAVSFGVPVIASDVGGLPDLALDDSYIVEPGNAAALAGAILRHIDDGAAVRRAVLNLIAAPRSWDAVAEKALALYERRVKVH